LPLYRFIRSRFAPARGTSGPPATGLMTIITATTTGFRAHGYWFPKLAISGLRLTGVGVVTDSFSMRAIGGRRLASMAASLTVTDISAMATKADAGTMASSITTVR